ncbi:MAG: N-acetylmuramoyl-L-alanine amidase, partial [Oscillospiraceae bacterium]
SAISTDGSSVTLTWNKVTGATSYRIYRADSATGTKTLLKAVTTATFTDTTVTAGDTYYYFVAAYDSVNKKLSAYSAAKSIKVETPLAAPAISVISSDGSSVTLTWNKVTGATSYRIYRAESATGAKTLLKAVTTATFTDTTVTAGKTYYYFVAAYDSTTGRLSAFSAAKCITV